MTFALDVSGVDVMSGQTQKVTIPAKGESYVDWRVKARATGNAVSPPRRSPMKNRTRSR